MNGKIIEPPYFKQPSAESLVQVLKVELGTSKVSCIIDQDAMGFLKATPVGHTADSRPNALTFANTAAQTEELTPQVSPEIPDELKQTMGSHLWLANLEASAKTPPSSRLVLEPEISGHPNPERPTAMTSAQLLDAQTQLVGISI